MEGRRGKNAPNWKDKVCKQSVHQWLNVTFGKLELCENENCLSKTKLYEWCLKTGMKYEKKRENFLRLCRSCHRKYDWNDKKTKQAIKNLWWLTGKKQNLARGEKVGTSKLSPEQVLEIRKNYNHKLAETAKKYGVSTNNITQIINKKLWKHL
jgi:hypothetical protein